MPSVCRYNCINRVVRPLRLRDNHVRYCTTATLARYRVLGFCTLSGRLGLLSGHARRHDQVYRNSCSLRLVVHILDSSARLFATYAHGGVTQDSGRRWETPRAIAHDLASSGGRFRFQLAFLRFHVATSHSGIHCDISDHQAQTVRAMTYFGSHSSRRRAPMSKTSSRPSSPGSVRSGSWGGGRWCYGQTQRRRCGATGPC